MDVNYDQNRSFDDCRVFFMMDGTQKPYFINPSRNDFQFLCYNKPSDREWALGLEQMLDVPEQEDGIEYGCFGVYGAMFYLAKHYDGEYISLGYENKYLDISASPKILESGIRRFIEPYAKMARSSEKLADAVQDFQWEQVRELFERLDIQAIGSLPAPAELCFSCSVRDSMILAYGETAAEHIFKILDDGLQSDELQGLFRFTPAMWQKFITDKNIEYLFMGKLKLMTQSCFQRYAHFTYLMLQKLYDALGQIAPALTGKASEVARNVPNFYEVIGDYLTAFYMYYLSQTDETEKKMACVRSLFFSEQGYPALTDSPIATDPGPAFDPLDSCPEYCDGQIVPVFQLWHEDFADMIYTTNRSEVRRLMLQGYSFEGSPGYVISSTVQGQCTPIYRLCLAAKHDHVYTLSIDERDSICLNLGYVQEDILGYQFNPGGMVTPDGTRYSAVRHTVQRYWCAQTVCHRYAAADDAYSVQQGYVLEGGCFHVVTFTPIQMPQTDILVQGAPLMPGISALHMAHSIFGVQAVYLLALGGAISLGVIIGGLLAYYYYKDEQEPEVKIKLIPYASVYVIHDGRDGESFPILTEPPMYSIMCGTVHDKRPNDWRTTTLRDRVEDKEFSAAAKSKFGSKLNCERYQLEDLYSEFTALYAILAQPFQSRYIGIMHYRSYLNLRAGVYTMPEKTNLEQLKLPEEQGVDSTLEPTATACMRMGYDASNIHKLMETEGYDIITSVPLNRSITDRTLTDQMLWSHGGADQTIKKQVLSMLIMAGHYINQYDESVMRHNSKDKKNTTTMKLPHSTEIVTISKSWNEYMGLEAYFDETQKIIPHPYYFKDLLLMKRELFSACIRFVLYILDNLYINQYSIIGIYEKNRGGKENPSRILAFLGERLIGYYINEMTCTGKAKTGVVPRAHYPEIVRFLSDLYPRYITDNGNQLLPVFKLCRKSASGKLQTLFVTDSERLKMHLAKSGTSDTGDSGFVTQGCVGYVFAGRDGNEAAVYLEEKTGILKANSTGGARLLGYMVTQNQVVIEQNGKKSYDTGKKVLCQWEKADTSELMLIEENIVLDGAKRVGDMEVSFATFGRSDLIEPV